MRQMQGRYKVKSADLRPSVRARAEAGRGFAHFAIEHVPREHNSEADELANLALDRTGLAAAEALRQPRHRQRRPSKPIGQRRCREARQG